MAYTPTTWTDNTTQANAARLNKLEQGVKEAHDLAESGTSETGIEYVAGIVELDETGDPVREFFTNGPATIDGTTYPAETAVVYFRIGGLWVPRVVDLPTPPPDPTVTHLATHQDESGTTNTPKSVYTFSGGTCPADGVLVAAMTTWLRQATTFKVGDLTLTYAATTSGANSLTPSMYYAPITQGESLDVEVTLASSGSEFIVVTLALVTEVAAVPYAILNSTNASPFVAPDSPAGSVIIGQHGNRGMWGGSSAIGYIPHEWEEDVTELALQTSPVNRASQPFPAWTVRHQVGWAWSTGDTGQVLTQDGNDHAALVFARTNP